MAAPAAAGVLVPARSHARRRIIRGVWAATAIVALIAGSCIVYVISLPGVGDALSRVKHILAIHHGTYEPPPPPRKLGDAVVSVEDEHFYDNFVVNVVDGAGRAALGVFQANRDPGGSTIDQQLAKQLYGGSSVSDIGLGVKLALSYSPRQIIAMYLNVAYYGHGYWGVAQAARGYFGATPARLTWGEAAMLGGLLQAPSSYDPLAHPALARSRERHVLSQLVVNDYLSARTASAALAAPLVPRAA